MAGKGADSAEIQEKGLVTVTLTGQLSSQTSGGGCLSIQDRGVILFTLAGATC